MSALSPILRAIEGGNVAFWCPGCAEAHVVGVEAPARVIWGYNGDPVAPTFTPSVLVTGHQRVLNDQGKWVGDWHRDAQGNALKSRCHSFVTNGQIQFLGDCSHSLAGQTVPLPAWPIHHSDGSL